MAETYKGLVIKIAGDTSELKRSLDSANSAIRTTQSQLRKLEKAAKFNNTGTTTLTQRLETMRDKANALSAKFRTLNETVRNLGSDEVKRLNSETENIAYSAEMAKKRYGETCAQIKKLKNEISEAASKAGLLETEFNVNDPSTDPFRYLRTVEDNVAKMRELGATTRQVAEYTDMLVPAYRRTSETVERLNKVAGFKDLKVQMTATRAEALELATAMARLRAENPMVTQTVQFQRIVREMKLAETEARELQTRLQGLDTAFNLDPTNLDLAKNKLQTMQEVIENNTARMKNLQSQLNAMKASGIDKVASDTKNLGTQLRETEIKLADLNAKLSEVKANPTIEVTTLKARDLENQIAQVTDRLQELAAAQKYRSVSASLNQLTAETNSLNNSLQQSVMRSAQFRGTMQNVGWSLAGTVTPAAQMFAMYAVNAADEVDTAYRNMRKTVQGTEEQFEALKQAAIDYSRTHVTSADTILEIEALGGQLGIATNKLEEFATTVSNLEIATNLDAETAATQLGQLSGILNDMTDNDFAKYGDALTRLGNNSATLESNISDVMLRIASMGTITGFSADQLLAWATAIASTGQGAEAAGTAISKTMSNIESAVGAGGEKLAGFAKVANMTATEFANAWKNDPSSAMQAFITGLKNIENSGGSADNTLANLGITAVRQKQAILGLTQTIDQLDSDLQMSSDAWNGIDDEWGDAGDAAREAQRKAEGFSGALQLLKNNAQAFGVELGDSVRPMLTWLAGAVEQVTAAYSKSPAAVKQFINVLILLTTIAGPTLIAISAIANAVNALKTTVAGAMTMKTAAAGMELAKTAAVGLSGAIETVVTSYKAGGMAASANAAKTTIATAATKACTVATNLLSTALKALPWVAVAALAAKAVSLFQTYSEECSKNKEAINSVSEAMGLLQSSAGTATVTYKNSMQDVINVATSARDSQTELANSWKESFAELNSNEALLNNYLGTIQQLAGNVGGSATNYQVLKQAVEGYNEITGESLKITNSTTGELNESTAELTKNAKAWIANAEAQAYQQAYTEAIKQRITNEAALKSVTDQLAKSENKYIKIGDVAISTVWGNELDQLRQLTDQKTQLENQTDVLAGTEQELLSKVNEASAKLAEYTDSTEGAVSQSDIFAGALNKTTDEFSSLVEETTTAVEGNANLSEFFNSTGLSIEEFTYACSAAGVSVSDLASSMDSMQEKVQNVFDAIESQSQVTIDDMISTLENNIIITEEWSTNLAALYQRAGDGAGKSLVDAIAAKGPEYASTVAGLVNADDEQWQTLLAKWQQGGSSAVTAAATGMNTSAETLVAAKNNVLGQATTTVEDGAAAMAGLVEGVDTTLATVGSNATNAGASTGSSYAAGVASTTGEASDAASGLATASESEIQTMKDTSWQIGAASGSNYATGLWSKTGESSSAGSGVASSAVNALSQYGDTAWQWGAHLGSNFAAGLWSKVDEASRAGSDIASAAGKSMHFSVPKQGIWSGPEKGGWRSGTHLVQNFAAGIEDEIPQLSRTVARLADTAAESLAGRSYSADLTATANASRTAQMSVNVIAGGSESTTEWLRKNLPGVIAESAPNLVIDNDAGTMIVDTRLNQLQRMAMNYG